jgi:YgiT-type zinc finger domain-containing protein
VSGCLSISAQSVPSIWARLRFIGAASKKAALAPWHKRATANARRLRRKREQVELLVTEPIRALLTPYPERAPVSQPYTGPPMTLGNAETAKVRLVVWCRDCQHQAEPDRAEDTARYGADLAVIDWVKRLTCSQCGSRYVDFVLTGARQ